MFEPRGGVEFSVQEPALGLVNDIEIIYPAILFSGRREGTRVNNFSSIAKFKTKELPPRGKEQAQLLPPIGSGG